MQVEVEVKKDVLYFFKDLPGSLRNLGTALWKAARKISFDKALLIWALAIIAGVFLFRILNRDIRANLIFATWWEDTLEEQTLSNLAAEFVAKNPGITVKLEKMNWEAIQKNLEEHAGENGRNAKRQRTLDIFSIDPHAVRELERRSYLAKLENNEKNSGNAMPVIAFINPLFYNIDLLQDAGFDRPPKNRTEFLSYVQRLKETGHYGAGLALEKPHNMDNQILSWIWAAAGNPESEKPFSFSSKEVIETLSFLNQLKQNLYPNPFELSETELLNAFGQGKVGMIIGSTADIQKLKQVKVNFGITTIPDPESYIKEPVFPLTVWYAGINSQSIQQEEAKIFLDFLKEKAGDIAAVIYAVPGDGVRSRELSRKDPYYAKAFDMYEAGDMVWELYSPDINSFYSIVHREIELMFRGNKTPEQCAQTIQQEWNRIAETTP